MQTQFTFTGKGIFLRNIYSSGHSMDMFIILFFLQFSLANGQENAVKLFTKMDGTYDQFNESFDSKSIDGVLTIIYIPGSNDPFGKIYDKHKGKSLAKNALFIGGFKEIMIGFPEKKKREHLQDALQARYDKNFKILLDLESEIGEHLSIKGYTILTASKQDNKIIKLNDYGFDRIAFFNVLQAYLFETNINPQ